MNVRGKCRKINIREPLKIGNPFSLREKTRMRGYLIHVFASLTLTLSRRERGFLEFP
jgi:hypothetical protein